jgi:hypothetical protein
MVMALAATAVFSGAAAAAVTPDPSCQQVAGHKSLNDNTAATILFVNNTSETVQTFWLNFKGDRVFYSQIAAGESHSQNTWITHPWIVADLSGACLKFYITSTSAPTVVVSDDAVAPATTTDTAATSQASTDSSGLAPTPPSTSPSGYGIAPTPPSQAPAGYGTAPTPPSQAPGGYDAAPTPPSTAPPGYNPPSGGET